MSEYLHDIDAPEEGTENVPQRRILTFALAQTRYGVPVDVVTHVVEPLPTTPLPHVEAFIVGIANFRGELLPILDLRIHFGLPVSDPTDHTRMIVVTSGEYTVGIIADCMFGLRGVPVDAVQPAPEEIASAYIKEVARVDGDRVMVLDLVPFLRDTALSTMEEQDA